MGNEMRKIGPKRVNHCPGAARVCTVAGWVVDCFRSDGKTSQVRWRNVAGLRFWLHLRRESTTVAKKRRRSELFFRPATLWLVTCDVWGCDLRHFGWSPATFWVVTCDSRGHHLQRFGLLPATVGAITCDTYSPWALASSQMASICARVRSRKESPLRRVCSSRYVKRRRNFSELRLRAVSGSTP